MSYYQARLRPGQPAQTPREPGFWLTSQGFRGDETLHDALWETGGHGEAQPFSSPMPQSHRRTQTPSRTATAPASSIEFPEPELPPTASAPHMSYPPPNMSLGASGPRVSYSPSHMSFGTFAPHPPYPSPAPDMFAAPLLHMPFPQPDMSFTPTAPSARDLAHHQLRSGTWPMPFLPYPNNGATTTAPPNPMYFSAAHYPNDSGYPYPCPAVPTGPSKQESCIYESPESGRKPSDSMPAHLSKELQEDDEPTVIEETDEKESVDRPGPPAHQAPSRTRSL